MIGSSSFFALALIGRMEIRAGINETDRRNAIVTPIAVRLPRWLKGGTSLKFRLKKPMTVDRLVKKIGPKFTRILSTIASDLLNPRRISRNIITRK